MASDDDDKKFIPDDLDPFMKALQDQGKINEKDKAKLIVYKDVQKYSATLAKMWKTKRFPNMPQNVTQAKAAISRLLIKQRNMVDAISVDEKYRKFANADGQLYIISNTPRIRMDNPHLISPGISPVQQWLSGLKTF